MVFSGGAGVCWMIIVEVSLEFFLDLIKYALRGRLYHHRNGCADRGSQAKRAIRADGSELGASRQVNALLGMANCLKASKRYGCAG